MKMLRECVVTMALVLVLALGFGCVSRAVQPEAATAGIPDGTVDPELWGRFHPEQYAGWKRTAEPAPAGGSRYKKGSDEGCGIPDKLDEFPFLALLYNGWAFGSEYREPRGHFYMVTDQQEVNPGRYKAGGSCLTCKTPYAPPLEREMGQEYFAKPYQEVRGRIPKEHRLLGVACIDCHDNRDLSLRISRGFTLGKGLEALAVDRAKLGRQEMRTLVCAQCHVTYSIPKDAAMKSTDVFFPWAGSRWGGIPIENIVKVLRENPPSGEWTQSVTGFKLAFIRHPEFEFFSNNSVHWQAGASCADCHMPAEKKGGREVTDHRVMSPLKNGLKACAQCHAEPPEALRAKVFEIQDLTVSRFIRAGYATATAAKLFEMAHRAGAAGRKLDAGLYREARDHYEEAFYRVVFIGAENSTGFHNPPEALRVLGDAARHAAQAEALLRRILHGAGVTVPAAVDLELAKYVDNRGAKKLMFKPGHEIKDPLAGR